MFLSAALHIPETERLLLVRRIANWYVKNLDQRTDKPHQATDVEQGLVDRIYFEL